MLGAIAWKKKKTNKKKTHEAPGDKERNVRPALHEKNDPNVEESRLSGACREAGGRVIGVEEEATGARERESKSKVEAPLGGARPHSCQIVGPGLPSPPPAPAPAPAPPRGRLATRSPWARRLRPDYHAGATRGQRGGNAEATRRQRGLPILREASREWRRIEAKRRAISSSGPRRHRET
jgi:hypothetical protein